MLVVAAAVSASGSPEEIATKVARWLNKSNDVQGRYTIEGSGIRLSLGDYKGTIKPDGLTLSWPGGPILEFQFIPLAEENLKEDRVEPKPFAEATLNLTGLEVVVRATLGQAIMDSECSEVNFTPLSAPPQYPSGTTELAYQVSIDPAPPQGLDAGVSISGDCGSAVKRGKTCNKYAVVQGQAVVTRSTTVVSCGSGDSFKPGRYRLELMLGGAPAKSISFEIR